MQLCKDCVCAMHVCLIFTVYLVLSVTLVQPLQEAKLIITEEHVSLMLVQGSPGRP